MHTLLPAATGTVGHGMLHADITDPRVDAVTVIARRAPAPAHPKMRMLTHQDYSEFTALHDECKGTDACCYAIGTASAGVSEADHTCVTRDHALAAAHTLLDAGSRPAYLHVSGRSADSTGTSTVMRARVKGAAQNALQALPMRTHILRPGHIRPRHGAHASSAGAQAFHTTTSPLFPVLHRLLPDWATSTEAIGRAAIALSLPDNTNPSILTSRDINRLAGM